MTALLPNGTFQDVRESNRLIGLSLRLSGGTQRASVADVDEDDLDDDELLDDEDGDLDDDEDDDILDDDDDDEED